MYYKKLTVKTTTENSELIANALFEQGALGVEIKDKADVLELVKSGKHWDYIDDSLIASYGESALAIGFFDYSADIKTISQIFTEETFCETGDSSSYENEWKKYYNPIQIENIQIVPIWLKEEEMRNGDGVVFAKPTPLTTNIYLDPGAAFGTGSHETTAMCVQLLQQLNLKNKQILDLGCGSGILGITALKLGGNHCHFVDIDPIATKSALDNATLNNVEKAGHFETCGFDVKLSKKSDILLANLTADLLIMCHPYLKNLLHMQADIIISGMLSELEKDVLAIYSKQFKVADRLEKNGWVALRLKSIN